MSVSLSIGRQAEAPLADDPARPVPVGKRPRFRLDRDTAIARGKSRLVFQHPGHPDRVIKVMTPGFRRRVSRRRRSFSMSGRYGCNKVFAKEALYLLDIEARRPDLLPLFPWIHGFVSTSLGLGMVQDKITSRDGTPARSLQDLVDSGCLTHRHRALAAELCNLLERDHVVFHDLTPANVVVAGALEATERLVIIDGFGDPYVPALRQRWAWFNRLAQRRRLRRFRERLGL